MMKKKIITTVLLLVGLAVPVITSAKVGNINETIRDNTDGKHGDSFWFSQKCDEIKIEEVYSGEYKIYVDEFTNSGNSAIYLQEVKVLTTGHYLKLNKSSFNGYEDFIILNTPLLQKINRKVDVNSRVRHMTTAEEIPGATFKEDRIFNKPVTLFGKTRRIPNYKSDGTHPKTPTNPSKNPNGPYDAEFRVITLYDTDNKFSTPRDNTGIVECLKNLIRRCGDGILDEEHEECDPEVEPWKSDGTCDPDTCKIAPKCNSKYNGKVVTGDLRKANDLCEVGNVTNLVETETNWTWNCDGVGDPVACSATKRKQGTPDIEKTLKDKIPVSHTGQKLDWEVKVTAKGGDITDFEIWDIVPKELEYESWSYGGQKPAGLTVTELGKTTRTGDDNSSIIRYWSVDGTLEEGKTLTIIVNTKVVKMPASGDNIINIACVIDDNNVIDCDDDTPPSPEGKPVIQKTLIDKIPVDHTGQQLDWNVKVTAKGGDITDFVISDIVPRELDYKDREIGENGDRLNVTYRDGASHSTGNGAEVHYWDVAGTLKSGHYLTIKVKTEVKEMPDPGENIVNIACVQLSGSDYVDCEPAETGNPKLRIKKRILDGSSLVKNKTVKIGDLITYRIDFGNSGNAAGTIVSIKDFVPKNVEYVSSQIFLSANHSSGTQNGNMNLPTEGWEVKDGVYIDIFGGITLEPGQRGYILLTGRILTGNTDQRHNFACIYDDEDLIACDDAKHDLGGCDKLEIATTTLSTNGGNTTVKCTTIGGQTGDIKIDCGNNKEIISGSNISVLSGTCNYPSGKKTYTVTCIVSPEKEASNSCKGTVSVPGNGGGSSCFVAGTLVTMADGTEKRIEEVKIGEKVLGQNGEVNEVKGYDRPTLDDRNLWKINGKGGYFVSDEHPFMTTKGWKSFDPVMSNIEIENARKEGMLKGGDYPIVSELEIGDILITKDGKEKITDLETLDPEKKDPNTQLYNLVLNGNNTYYANGYLVHNKGTSGGGGSKSPVCQRIDTSISDGIKCESHTAQAYFKLTCDDKEFKSDDKDFDYKFKFEDENGDIGKYCKTAKKIECAVSKTKNGTYESSKDCKKSGMDNSEECINVNAGNFSIHEGEIFPFYWNMANLNSEYYNQENSYTTIDGDYTNPESKYSKNLECSKGDENKIAMDSMICTFNIYDANVYTKRYENGETKKHPLYTIKGPCLSSKSVIENKPLIKDWYNTMVENYCKDKECYFYYGTKGNYEGYNGKDIVLPTAVYFIEKFGTGARLSVDAGGGWTTWDLKREDSPEKDKSFGEYKIELSNVEYLKCDGEHWTKVENKDMDPCQSDFMLTNSYTVQKTPSGNLTASTEKLKNYRFYNGTQTFSDLLKAIQTTSYNKNDKVENAMKTFTSKYEKLAVNVKGGIADRDSNKNATIKKVPGKSIYFVDGDVVIYGTKDVKSPFTMVVKGNVTIEGNVNNNMMVLAEKNIIFKGDCESTQTVKGIFYAGGNLIRQGVDKNDNINNNRRCTEGGLHVKGVLIGNNFNKLMDDSRSNINKWFGVEGSEQEIINKRRKIVMDGASVVIEYSPSIFTKSTMPPGAEDFTTALSIYKN